MKGQVENQTVNQLHMVNFTLNRLVCDTIQALKFHTKTTMNSWYKTSERNPEC